MRTRFIFGEPAEKVVEADAVTGYIDTPSLGTSFGYRFDSDDKTVRMSVDGWLGLDDIDFLIDFLAAARDNLKNT